MNKKNLLGLLDGISSKPSENKNVLITGASRGLGFDLTKKYLDYGANVISVSRSGIQKINNKHMHLKLDLEKKFSKEKLLLFFKKKKNISRYFN